MLDISESLLFKVLESCNEVKNMSSSYCYLTNLSPRSASYPHKRSYDTWDRTYFLENQQLNKSREYNTDVTRR